MDGASKFPHDGDQLRLELDWGSEPWEGRSPRALTKVALSLFLRQKPPRHEVYVDPEQLEFWPVDEATQKEGPRATPGAPLLVSLKRTRRGRRLLWQEDV